MNKLLLALILSVSFSSSHAELVYYQDDMQMVPENFYPYQNADYDHYSASVDAVWDTETNTFQTFSISVIGYPLPASVDISDTAVYLGQPWSGTGDDSDGIVHALPNSMTQDGVTGEITFSWDGYDPVANGMSWWLADNYLDVGSARFTIYGNINVAAGNIPDQNDHHWGEAAFTASFEPATTGVDNYPVPSVTTMLDAYPNPFNPQTTIAFDLPKQATVSLRVFDVFGRLVRVLANGDVYSQGRNEVSWNGRNAQGQPVASGIYLYRLDGEGFTETRRMALVK